MANKVLKVVREGDYYHARIRQPGRFRKGSFRNTSFGGKLPATVRVVRGRLKTSNQWATQSVLFRVAEKTRYPWTVAKVRSWLRRHRSLWE